MTQEESHPDQEGDTDNRRRRQSGQVTEQGALLSGRPAGLPTRTAARSAPALIGVTADEHWVIRHGSTYALLLIANQRPAAPSPLRAGPTPGSRAPEPGRAAQTFPAPSIPQPGNGRERGRHTRGAGAGRQAARPSGPEYGLRPTQSAARRHHPGCGPADPPRAPPAGPPGAGPADPPGILAGPSRGPGRTQPEGSGRPTRGVPAGPSAGLGRPTRVPRRPPPGVPAGRPRDRPQAHPGHIAETPAGTPSPAPAGRADRTHRAARGPSRVPPAGPPRHRPESGSRRGAGRGDRPGGADFKGWRGRSSPRAPALNYARGIGRRGRIPDVAGESEILRRDKAARPGRSAGLSGQVSRANRSRRTRAGWRVPADQGQPASAGGPGPAGQCQRTRASRPAPADQAGRPRNGRQGRAARARRPHAGRTSVGGPCRAGPCRATRAGRPSGQPSARVPARRHGLAGRRTRRAGHRHQGHRHQDTRTATEGSTAQAPRPGCFRPGPGTRPGVGRGRVTPAAGPGGQLGPPAGAAEEGANNRANTRLSRIPSTVHTDYGESS
jgi:hypothetical protein